ncbi:alpha/beta hydrolase [Paenimyroides tangerinum]|uniref:Alpha/beta hydrolase n=1 Tax=Paenimyroides tangerinum TaxID=2488728 RepID=A0A3P3VZ69_9FLAO|nr:alpha/beta hydrolase [Paenimyroides tangerinum]RRJ88010.1 alpha/beta hydrolase [Paenimyroides tangerinum]
MKKLILLSDIWGIEKSNWMFQYTSILEQYFEIHYYDCRELACIPEAELSEENIHSQFVNGGIDTAVKKLLEIEHEASVVVGFSIGGCIGWKACLSGLKVQHLFAISSTRLRYETEKPFAKIELFYGEKDCYKPDASWFQQMQIKEEVCENEEHELYQKKEVVEYFCKKIIEKIYNQNH